MPHWSSLLALAACTPQVPTAPPDPEPRPIPEETGAPTGDTASPSGRASATWTEPQAWSDQGTGNHATVTFDALGAPVVAWTEGQAIGPSWLQVLDLTGARDGPPQGLGRLQIPDVHGSPTGLYIGAHLNEGGVWLLHGQPGETPDRLLVGDSSTASGSPNADLDVGSDGFVRVVWFAQGDPGRGFGHRVAADLSALIGPPQVLAQTSGDTRMTPDTVAMADGGTLVSWVDQVPDGPDELHVMALELDSSVRWDRVVVSLDDASPRRPTVSTGADGRW